MAASAGGQTCSCIRKQVPLTVAQGSSLFLNGLVHLVSSLQSQPERPPAPSAMEMLPLSFVRVSELLPDWKAGAPELTLASDVFAGGSLNLLIKSGTWADFFLAYDVFLLGVWNLSWTSAGTLWADFSLRCLLLGVSEPLLDRCRCPLSWLELLQYDAAVCRRQWLREHFVIPHTQGFGDCKCLSRKNLSPNNRFSNKRRSGLL